MIIGTTSTDDDALPNGDKGTDGVSTDADKPTDSMPAGVETAVLRERVHSLEEQLGNASGTLSSCTACEGRSCQHLPTQSWWKNLLPGRRTE